ncbi:kelch-like protein 33 isoform X2 [Eurytemora carolleeae]|uniref:kelch-like protein 33 isoform X1 n=1 Tax=Eurytemora carolleeae TaxID=1294199 RepID=UPI000C77AF26|nr:kelch-like protein 33 isoform X1 [Eurytemora carolleeae]XP_023322031.1 kelch-like protein 33 isoform X2 [Eurytemora carolleeae]|eukprot:XP_023322030.1 kelch-like protein 33 isoform X1 [Eurytemora affinis]
MNNLRNGIEYLKTTCEGEVIVGCQWAEWSPWSSCSKTCGGGLKSRSREKLPGMGTCDGDASAVEVCAEQEVCPLENDNTTLVVVIGGETTRENRENEHSTSIEIIGASGLCRLSGVPDLPEARGKLCAAYDPSGALIVCGGGQRFWRPNNNCWQLVKGYSTWEEIPQIYPVHGAATTFFRGKFWVFGGSTGDDSYDHTITDKVQAYNPRTQVWSVEKSLSSPRHKSCAVTIDDQVVLTGGTMLGLGKVKPVWLAEIGTRTAESFDGENWYSLPSLTRAKVEHGCSVAAISGSRGILVVGGATGDDVVEFLDWDIKSAWKVLGKLNRGRGMMPGIGFIGGKLSIVGGYSWPGAVDIIEQWDEDKEEWSRSINKIKYARYNHATITVPGDMFPQCLNP